MPRRKQKTVSSGWGQLIDGKMWLDEDGVHVFKIDGSGVYVDADIIKESGIQPGEEVHVRLSIEKRRTT